MAGFESAGFVDDARKLVNDGLAVDILGFWDINKGDVSTLEEFLHVLRAAAGVFCGLGVVEFDGANGAESAFIAEDEIDGFIFDEMISGMAILSADFVIEEGGEADLGDNIEFLTK